MRPDKPLPPVYFLTGLIAMIVLHFLLPVVNFIGPPWRYAGLLPVAIGIILNLWADGLFKRYGTEVKPFRESSALVMEGPFRFSRNPMYLGGLLIYLGAWILMGSAMPLLVIIVMFWLVRAHFIIPEEQDMQRQFGERYLEFKGKTRRWL